MPWKLIVASSLLLWFISSTVFANTNLHIYAGKYQPDSNTIVTITAENEQLNLVVGAGPAMQFTAAPEGKFIHVASGTTITFTTNSLNQVVDLVMVRKGKEHRAKRVSVVTDPDNPVKTIEVDGITFRYQKMGSGKQSVVFLGSPEKWASVANVLATNAQVISIEKKSLPAAKPLAQETQMRQLNEAFNNIQIKPPFILVGHSIGGAKARIYVRHYAQNVSGLVLVDPFHEDIVAWIKQNQPENYDLWKKEYAEEWDDVLAQLDQARTLRPKPFVLLTAGNRIRRKDNNLEQRINAERFDKAAKAILQAHQEWTRKNGGAHILVSSVGHEIPADKPEAVIDAINQLLKQIY